MNKFKSGLLVDQGYYKAFIPSEINREWTITDNKILHLLSQADQQLGRLDMYSHYINVAHYINLHIAKEATQSSRIEGTRTEVRETFLKAEDIAADRRADWEEVQNYIEAMNFAVEELTRLPYSSRLFRKAHKLLLQGVR